MNFARDPKNPHVFTPRSIPVNKTFDSSSPSISDVAASIAATNNMTPLKRKAPNLSPEALNSVDFNDVATDKRIKREPSISSSELSDPPSSPSSPWTQQPASGTPGRARLRARKTPNSGSNGTGKLTAITEDSPLQRMRASMTDVEQESMRREKELKHLVAMNEELKKTVKSHCVDKVRQGTQLKTKDSQIMTLSSKVTNLQSEVGSLKQKLKVYEKIKEMMASDNTNQG